MKRDIPLFFLLVLAVSSAVPAEGREGTLEITLDSAGYRFVEGRDGKRIEMAGFGYLKEPGKPSLPEKEFLVLLAPGARALSLDVEPIGTRRLPGTFELAPTPPLLPLTGRPLDPEPAGTVMAEWARVRQAAYADDRAYPATAARIVGSGTLRKYSYVRIAFHPFAYHAASGRLFHHGKARVLVRYALPDRKSVDARRTEESLSDTVADDRAARLFVNYDDLKRLYRSRDRQETSPGEIVSHDYVIITTPWNVDAIEASDFLEWKSSLGHRVKIVLITDPEITGQPGADPAERIRNFLRVNYIRWSIEHVLLVGEFPYVPMRYCYPDPNNHAHDPADPGLGPGSVPTDAYYADLSFSDARSWDLDGDGYHGEYTQDSPDFLAEVNVGRIPTSDDSRITYTLDKLVRVEQDSGDWKRHALHAGAILFFENQNGSGHPFRDGAVFPHETETHLMQEWVMSRYSEQEGLVSSLFPWPNLTLQAFLSDWNDGKYGFVNWAAHGWPDGAYRTIWQWDDGDGIPETDGSDGMVSDPFITDSVILDDDYPSIVCAVSCDVAYPEPNNSGGNLGVHLLTNTARGAASAVMAATRYAAVSSDWPALPGGADSLCYEFNRHLIAGPGGVRTLGAAVYESKFFSHVNYGWDHTYEYRNMYNYNLYGDPAMDWRGAGPRTANLLRNVEVEQCEPVTPPLCDLLPLDAVEDVHVPDFVAGETDPDPAAGASLVFYAIDSPARIWLHKTPAGEVRIDF